MLRSLCGGAVFAVHCENTLRYSRNRVNRTLSQWKYEIKICGTKGLILHDLALLLTSPKGNNLLD